MRNAIFLFPHPDDEIGVFPLLEACIAEGIGVVCVYLTDGGWGGQDIGRRQRESRRVLSAMGVTDVRFLGEMWSVPDGDLYRSLDRVISLLERELSAVLRFADLFVPAWEGGHPDHDAAHIIGAWLGQQGYEARVRQFSLYHGAGLRGPLFRVLAPLFENGQVEVIPVSLRGRIRCVLRCLGYPSQWRSFVGLLPLYALKMIRRHPFGVQPVDPRRTAERPHAGMPLYERRGTGSWDEFAQATAAWREERVPKLNHP